jgi:hypothetical protein
MSPQLSGTPVVDVPVDVVGSPLVSLALVVDGDVVVGVSVVSPVVVGDAVVDVGSPVDVSSVVPVDEPVLSPEVSRPRSPHPPSRPNNRQMDRERSMPTLL